MAVWQTPVYDRSYTDIQIARAYLRGEYFREPFQAADDEFSGSDMPFTVISSYVPFQAADDVLHGSDQEYLVRAEVYELKGFLNATDVNRIEGNTQYLYDALRYWGYSVTGLDSILSGWTMEDIFQQPDLARIRLNVGCITDALPPPGKLWINPSPWIGYGAVNAMEKNLALVYRALEQLQDGLRYCGQATCGQEVRF